MIFSAMSAVALARSTAVLSIHVVAPDGTPLQAASMRFLSPNEYEDHCMDVFDGSWEGAAFHLRGDSTSGDSLPRDVPFRPGTDVTFSVYAPGYSPATVHTTLGKATDLTVRLEAATPDSRPPYGLLGVCHEDPAKRVEDPKATDRRALTEVSCGTTVVLRGTIGVLDLTLPAPTDGSRWTTPFAAEPEVLERLGPGSRDGGAVTQMYAFRDYGETTLVIDRVAGDGSVAQTCIMHAIMRPTL